MKLQDAYTAETGALGAWKTIGYVAPGVADTANGKGTTTAFTYSGGKVTSQTTCSEGSTWNASLEKCKSSTEGGADGSVLGAEIEKGWVAHNNTKLNECNPGDHWDISAKVGTASTNPGAVTYVKSELPTECDQLTPQFGNIGK